MPTKYKRIRKRIERDKQRRKETKEMFQMPYDNYDFVFTYSKYYKSMQRCNKGVMFKKSVQYCNMNAVEIAYSDMETLLNGKIPKIEKSNEIIVRERGKERKIVPVRYRDRIIQRMLSDNALVPCLGRTFVYDNGASMVNKGTNFARKRMMKMMLNAVKTYGKDFYVLVYDFSDFFNSISHEACLKILNDTFSDKRIVNATMDIIKEYAVSKVTKQNLSNDEQARLLNLISTNKGHGLCLGSQNSQILSLAIPNKIDHMIKEKYHIGLSNRYMDDGIVIHNDASVLKEVIKDIARLGRDIGISLNTKKTRIVKATHGFTFLKTRYFVTVGNRVVRTLVRSGIVRMRRKLKKFKTLVDNGKMSLNDVYSSLKSWIARCKCCNSYHTIKSMLHLYNILFDGYRITSRYFKKYKYA